MTVGELRAEIEASGLPDSAPVVLIEVGLSDTLGQAQGAGKGGSVDGDIFVIDVPAGKFHPDG